MRRIPAICSNSHAEVSWVRFTAAACRSGDVLGHDPVERRVQSFGLGQSSVISTRRVPSGDWTFIPEPSTPPHSFGVCGPAGSPDMR